MRLAEQARHTHSPSVTDYVGNQRCSNRNKATMSVISVSPSSNSAWCQCLTPSKLIFKNRKKDLIQIILLRLYPYSPCNTTHIIKHWLVQTCVTAYSNETLNASIWTSAKGNYKIWPPAPTVQPRQVYARISSVAYSVTGCCLNLFLNVLCSSYSAVSN